MLEFFDGMNRWERTAELIQIIIWLPASGSRKANFGFMQRREFSIIVI